MKTFTNGDRTVSTATSFYAPEVLPHIGRLLSCLDREIDSVSAGCFDRDYWSWKFRDHPIGMMQTAVYPLALVWERDLPGNALYRHPSLLRWIVSALEFTCRRQKRNGTFDAFTPNEQDVGSTLGVMHGLAEALRIIREHVPVATAAQFERAIQRAADFALQRHENHAFVSNHWAWYAVAFLNAHELLGDERYLSRAEEILDRILEMQSPEGWYREYDGADPGYESLGIFHLAIYWRRTGSARLLESLRKSVEFYSHFVHPDASIGGCYGSRHTALFYPAGFEILSREIPLAASVASFMRARIGMRNVVTPALADTENLIPLSYGYLEACVGIEAEREKPHPELPCENLDGVRRFPDAGLVVCGTKSYYAVVSTAKGGICRVFDKESGKIAYEDAGYVIRAGKRLLTSQRLGSAKDLGTPVPGTIGLETQFTEARPMLPTPLKYMLLRALNLTVFRSPTLAGLVRRVIVGRLITGKRSSLIRLKRFVRLEEDRLLVSDEITKPAGVRVDRVDLTRSFTAIHMGSAKYFANSEIEPTPLPDMEQITRDLTAVNVGRVCFELCFGDGAPMVLRMTDQKELPMNRESEMEVLNR